MWRTWLVLAVVLLAAPAARAEDPAIARPGLPDIGQSAADARGVVFFLAVRHPPGVAAVGTAHTLRLEDLARAARVELALPRSLRRVATADGLLVPPGRPFSLPGASLREDFLVYALEAEPRGVRVLEAETATPLAPGLRVRVLGPPARGRRDVHDAFGTIAAVSEERIDVDLDLSQSLEGWGGAPVLLTDTERVIGMVEAAVPRPTGARVLAAPIGAVLEALRHPLDGGAGRAFAAFAPDDAADDAPARDDPAVPADDAPGSRGALLDPSPEEPVALELSIEYPPDGAQVDATVCGSFVAGRALAQRGRMRRFDVVMVLDTSRSTIDPAGTDVNGNGEVGRPRLGRLGAFFGSSLTDPGDSILAAEVAAARQLLRGLDPRSTRVALVGFAGDGSGGGRYASRKPAYTLEPLTRDYRRIERGLDELLETEPEGNTHMAAGVDQATIELLGLRGSHSKPDRGSEKVVFFFTDGQPTLPYGPEDEADNVRAVLRAASRARRADVRIHSFAIGPDALEGPIATVEMASRTRGYFTPVRHPGDLVDVVEEVSFANLQDVRLEHVDTGRTARPFRVTADGTWAGFVPLEPGPNRVRVSATADDGTTAERRIEVTLTDDAAAVAELPRALVVQRNRLLEDCLRDTKRLRLRAEQERLDALRRELRIEIERERAKARERADEQRKTLDLEGDVDDE